MFAAAALADSSAGPLFSRGRLDTAVALLRWIHSHYPQTRNVGAGADVSLQFRLSDSMANHLVDTQRPTPLDSWLNPPRTGIPEFDQITNDLGGASAIHLQGFVPVLTLVTVFYREPVNIPAVARQYTSLRPAITISPLQGLVIGSIDGTRVDVTDSSWNVHMITGWGDCLAGCIYRHFWTFKYFPASGQVRVVADSGPQIPSERNGG